MVKSFFNDLRKFINDLRNVARVFTQPGEEADGKLGFVAVRLLTLAATHRRLLGSRLSKFQADFIGGVLQQSAIDNGKILLGDRIVAPLQVQ